MKVVILGFYNRNNLGDDSFENAFRKLFEGFQQYELIFKNTDDISCLPKETDIVVCGGGDIVNEYFYLRIHLILENSKWFNGPVYSISVGIPHHDVIERGLLDCCDHISVRFQEDMPILVQRYGSENVTFAPDITCLLDYYEEDVVQKNLKHRIVVFLARPICNNKEGYDEICRNVALALDTIGNQHNSEIVLACFNTDNHNRKEDDRIINKDVYHYCTSPNISVNMERFTFDSMQEFIKTFDLSICMRYHAHVFSLMNGVPLISLNCSNKVGKFLRDVNYPHPLIYDIKKAEGFDYPDKIDYNEILTCFQMYITSKSYVQENVSSIRQELKTKSLLYYDFLTSLLDTNLSKKRKITPVHNPKRRPTAPFCILPKEMEQRKTNILALLIREIDSTLNVAATTTEVIHGTKKLFELVPNHRNIEELADTLAKIICFDVTRMFKPTYHYGLKEKILTEHYLFPEEYEWLIKDWNVNPMNPKMKQNTSNPGKFDLFCLDQLDYSGVHRSGWQFVVDNLLPLHKDGETIMDVYMDKTFGWQSQMYEKMGVIPYTRPWVGFVHHTCNTEYSDNNVVTLFKNENLLKSLPTCKGIFVLSNYMAKQLRNLLKQVDSNIPINVLYHPTERPSKCFDLKSFMNNPERRVIQVGAWLRESYAIFELPIYAPEKEDGYWYNNNLHIRKAVIKGKSMENHFRPRVINMQMLNEDDESSTQLVRCRCNCLCSTESERSCKCDYESFSNKYVEGLINFIERNDASVEIIGTLDNDEYDFLLSENIVFLKLVDVSAANTIIECITRFTPILVNKHPAIVEYLGEKYPFYYENLREAADKATNFETIMKAHYYLRENTFTNLTVEAFIDSLLKSEVVANL